MKQVVTFKEPIEQNGHMYCPLCRTLLEKEDLSSEDDYSIMPANDYYECLNCDYYWVDE